MQNYSLVPISSESGPATTGVLMYITIVFNIIRFTNIEEGSKILASWATILAALTTFAVGLYTLKRMRKEDKNKK